MKSVDKELRWWRRTAGLAILCALISIVGCLWIFLEASDFVVIPISEASSGASGAGSEEPIPDRIDFSLATFEDLPGWSGDTLLEALPLLKASCKSWLLASKGEATYALGEGFGNWSDWREFCSELVEIPELRSAFQEALKRFLVPVSIRNHGERQGLFTGYYEASLRGSRKRYGRYQVPLYSRPPDLISVNLGTFREDLGGRRIAGRLSRGRLEPFADRAEIEGGALAGRDLEILWVDDPVDAFFLHIQGSGRVLLEDGSSVRLGYSSQNGHPYTAIGRALIESGEVSREEISMQSIRYWLEGHSSEAAKLMNSNESFVFFRILEGPGPIGSMGLALTPERSLAVDRQFIPLGVPLWLAADPPKANEEAIQRLVVAQDTGGAIRGPVRGDLFWGYGDRAAELAGPMKSGGEIWGLVPRSVAGLSARGPTVGGGDAL